LKTLIPFIALLVICATAHAGVDPIFDRLMVIRRRSKGGKRNDLGLPVNSSSNPQIFGEFKKWNNRIDNEIVTFSLKESYKKYSVGP